MQMFPYVSVRQIIIYEGRLQLCGRNSFIKAVVFRKESAMLSQQLQLFSYKEAVYR